MSDDNSDNTPKNSQTEDPVVKDIGIIADESKQKTFFGKLRAEFFIAGYRAFHVFDADGKNHLPFFIFMISIVDATIFAVMLTIDGSNSSISQLSTEIEIKFGALDSGIIAANNLQIWRVFSSIFLHASLEHLLNNLAAQILIGWSIERKFGFWITAFIYILSGIGGNIFSLVFESFTYTTVVGASGCACGLLGTYISDWIKNRESIKMPILRAIFVAVVIILLFVQGALDSSISNFSHLGGLYTGIFPIVNALPNLKKEKWEVILLYTGLFSSIMEFIGMPLIYFLIIVPELLS